MTHNQMDHLQQMDTMQHGGATFMNLWSPGILLIAVVLAALYAFMAGPLRSRFRDSSPVGSGKQAAFYTAAFLYYVAEGTPIGYYGHDRLFSMHMLQMSIVYLVIPPLVYLSLPEWLARQILERPGVRKWLYPLTNPLLAIFLFNMVFSFYHIPFIFNEAYQSIWLHYGYHALLGVLAFHMWFPVFCPLREWNRIGDLQKLGYIFGNGILLTPACALIIFASDVMYPGFTLPESWARHMTPLDDQQLGGTIMKIMQEIVYGLALAYIFFKWYRTERKKEADDIAESASLRADPGSSPLT